MTVYGSGTSRYVRIEEPLEVGEKLRTCVDSGKDYGHTFRLKSNGTSHPADMDFNESRRCHKWNLSQDYVDGKLRVSIWGRNDDSTFEHGNRSNSDYYIQVLYENVTFEEGKAGDTGQRGGKNPFEMFLNWLKFWE